jgi:hypothetical protein
MKRFGSTRGNSKGGREQTVGVNEATPTVRHTRTDCFAINNNNNNGAGFGVLLRRKALLFTYLTIHSIDNRALSPLVPKCTLRRVTSNSPDGVLNTEVLEGRS